MIIAPSPAKCSMVPSWAVNSRRTPTPGNLVSRTSAMPHCAAKSRRAADDLPGLGGVAAAAAADVGELRVVSVPGGAHELAAAADALSSPGMWVEPLEDDGEQIGLIVASPIDIVGTMDRWALRALGGHVVLIRGRGDDPARYAASL